MTADRPRLVTRPTPGFEGLTMEICSREGAVFAHSFAMGAAAGCRLTGNNGAHAYWLMLAGEIRRWAGGKPPRRQRHDSDPYPTVIETFPRLIPRWTDDA